MTRFQRMLLGSLVFSATTSLGVAIFKPGPPPVDPARWATVEAPSVEVLFSGVPPREVRRYEPAPGTRRDLAITLEQGASTAMAGQDLNSLEGGAEVVVRTWVDDVQADGAIAWRWRVRSAKVTADVVDGNMPRDAWREAVRGLKGLRGTSILDPQGHVLEHEREGGRPNALALAQDLERMLREPVPHLPDAPIGDRAQWRVRRVVLNDGVRTTLEERWKLLSMSDSGWELEATLSGSASADAPPQALPGLESAGGLQHSVTGAGLWSLDPRGDLLMAGEGWTEGEGALDPGVPSAPGLSLRTQTAGSVRLTPRE